MYESTISSTLPSVGGTLDFFGDDGLGFKLSDIFEVGGALLYAGSTFTIQESMEVITLITEPKYIDADFRYHVAKRRLGFWQRFDLSNLGGYPEESGELNYLINRFDRYHNYTVTGNPDNIYLTGNDIKIDDCNFLSQAFEATFGGITVAQSNLVNKEDVLRGTIFARAVPLQDAEFLPKLSGMAIKLLPGVEFESAKYTIRPINFAYNDSLPAPTRVCTTAQPSCSDQFAAFIAGGNNRYANITDLPQEVQDTNTYGTSSWSSESIPDCTFPYYFISEN